jgi:hypothetical protein
MICLLLAPISHAAQQVKVPSGRATAAALKLLRTHGPAAGDLLKHMHKPDGSKKVDYYRLLSTVECAFMVVWPLAYSQEGVCVHSACCVRVQPVSLMRG